MLELELVLELVLELEMVLVLELELELVLLQILEMMLDLVVDLFFFWIRLVELDLFLSIERLRIGEIMTHLTKIHCLRYPFFLLILILSHIRIIIPFAWASWRAFCSASFAAFHLVKSARVVSPEA